MTPVERQTFQLHAETEGYLSRVEAAKAIVIDGVDRAKKPYVAFSGGKDSTVMLHLCLQEAPNILVWHWDYGKYYMPAEIEEEIQAIARILGVKNVIFHTSKKYATMKRSPKNVLFPTFFGGIQKDMIRDGIDLAFIGLRAQESNKRRFKTADPFRWNGVLTECYPLRGLTTKDVWAYIISNVLPHCSHYDRYGALLGIEHVRMSTFFDPEFAYLGAQNLDGMLMPGFKNR